MKNLKIYCDEAGFTGDDLLEDTQPYFVYSAVNLPDEIISEIVSYIYDNYRIQNAEIKGKNIVRNTKGQAVIKYIFEKYAKYARIVYHEKKYALAVKIVEYGVEPYLKSNDLFYRSELHKYLTSGFYLNLKVKDHSAEFFFHEFVQLARKKKRFEETLLHDPAQKDSLLKWVSEIIAHRPEIMLDTLQYNGTDPQTKWLLDLTTTSLFGLLTEWSKNDEELEVICDDSKVFDNSSIIKLYNEIGLKNSRVDFLGTTIGFKLKNDIVNSNSKQTLGLQIADLFSSTVFYCLKNGESEFSKSIMEIVYKNCLCTPKTFCVIPSISEDVKRYTKEKLAYYHQFMALIYAREMES